ncbi:MAG TPA: CHASE3 domain-containing protein [Methylomirabilota bacterium]|jgi:CHASE3 domain sensor protein|nr:CHASE3 domain-containing protein [Methylomirabilota bacterium]
MNLSLFTSPMSRKEQQGRWFIKSPTMLSWSAGLLMASLICLAAYWHRATLMQAANQAAHARTVCDKLDAVSLHLAQAEIAQHTYLLTGNAQALSASAAAQEVIQNDLAELRMLTREPLAQQHRLSTLEFRVQEAFASWQWTLDLWKRQGLKGATQELGTGKSVKTIEEVQHLIRDMAAAEQALAQQQLKKANRSGARVFLAVSVMSVAILILLLLRTLFLRHFHPGARTEAALLPEKDEHRQRVLTHGREGMPTLASTARRSA